MTNCQNCEKLIPEPGIAYGINPDALCKCTNPKPYKPLTNNIPSVFQSPTDKVGLRETLTEIMYGADWKKTDQLLTWKPDVEAAIKAVLAHFEGTRPEKPVFPSLEEYMKMVKYAEAHNKYDDMYEYGHRQAIDTWDKDFKEGL